MSERGRLSGFLLDAIFNNFWLKLIALVSGLGFYAFIHSAENLNQKFEVQVRYEVPDPGEVKKALSSDIPRTIIVEVEGPASAIQSITEGDLSILLNLTGGVDGDLKLEQDMVNNLPNRVRVTRFSPPRIEIRFEPIITSNIKVQVSRTGEPAKGMEVTGAIVVEPEEVVATGIKSRVDTIQFARADAFDVTGLDEGRHTRSLKLADPPPGVTFDNAAVTARLDVARKLAEKSFDSVSVEVVGSPRAKTRPPVVNVKIIGAPEKVAAITKEMIVPQVDLAKAEIDFSTPGSESFDVIIELPDLTLEVVPPKVLVKW